MMSSATSPVRQALQEYLDGRRAAEQVVETVAAAYYADRGNGGLGAARERLRPVLDVIERVAPGTVELNRLEGSGGFGVKAVGRTFPPSHENDLRAAVEAVLREWEIRPGATKRGPGLLARLAGAIRRLFRG